jgi:hypothetical protein
MQNTTSVPFIEGDPLASRRGVTSAKVLLSFDLVIYNTIPAGLHLLLIVDKHTPSRAEHCISLDTVSFNSTKVYLFFKLQFLES